MQAILGLFVFVAIAALMSERKREIPWKRVGISVAMQAVIALAMLKLPILGDALKWLSGGVIALQKAADSGAQFMFGYLAGGPAPFAVTAPQHNFLVAFRVLPLILVVSVLAGALFHLGVLPAIIRAFAKVLQRVFGLSGVLGFSAAASVFMGIIESPLLIKPYLERLERAELFALLVCGMSTVAGTVMVLYAQVIGTAVPGAMGHILVASVISVPAALALSQVVIPPPPHNPEADAEAFHYERETSSVIEAMLKGLNDGVSMVLNIAAVLVVLFALVHLVDAGLALLPSWSDKPLSITLIGGAIMRPIVWLAGVPWAESQVAGQLMATKTFLNEFVAYLTLAKLPADALSPHSRLVMTYAMCGFANFGSLGILVGGLGALVPDRREELVALGWRALIVGTLTTLMTASIISVYSSLLDLS